MKYLASSFVKDQRVKCIFDDGPLGKKWELVGKVTLVDANEGYILVDVPDISDHCRYEEGFNLESSYIVPMDYAILEKFFFECVRYWEKELNVSSDYSKEPYINAIKEIPTTYPYAPAGYALNTEIREKFIKSRYMDCYGKEWEKYYNKERGK